METKQGNWFTGILAKLFGNKVIFDDEDGLLIVYVWRNRYYVTHFEIKDEHETINT